MKTVLPPFLRQAAQLSQASARQSLASFKWPSPGTLQPFMFDELRRIS